VHKSFLAIDEKGMEAGAASIAILPVEIPPKPMVMKVDHPFLFAVQHVPSGACLFLGRVTDPR
jgi:serpin B